MRRIFFIIVLGLLTQSAFSQVKMGIRLAPQLTWTSTDSKAIGTAGTGVNIAYGLMIDYYFTENYGVGTELGVNTFGGSVTADSIDFERGLTRFTAYDMEYNYKLQYITMPLLIKMKTKEIGYFRYYGEIGLGLGFLFRSKADFNIKGGPDFNDVNVNDPDPADEFKLRNYDRPVGTELSQKVNFFRTSLIVGAGVQYNIFGNTMLMAGLRYDNALNDFTDETRWKANMNFLALQLGVLF